MRSFHAITVSDVLFVLGAVLGSPLSASAGPIPVPTYSFETPDAPDGESWFFSNTDWDFGGSGFFQMSVTDFDDSSYPGSNGDNTPLPGTAQGGQAAFIALQSLASVGQLTSGSLTSVSDDTVYTLTVALGNALNRTLPNISTLQILVGGTIVASTSVSPGSIPEGTFTDFTTSFTTAAVADPRAGGALSVRLEVSSDLPNEFGHWQTDFDNVRLTASTHHVPDESSTLLLTTGSLVALGAWRTPSRARKA